MDNQKLRVLYFMVHPFSHIFAMPTLVNEFSTHKSVFLSWLFCSFDLFFYSEANSLWAERFYFHNKSIFISQAIPLLLFFLFVGLDPSWPFVLTHTHTHTHTSWHRIWIIQLLSRAQFFEIPWTAALQASLSFAISWSLLKLMSVELVMLLNNLILCCPLLLLPSNFSNIKVFSNELVLHIRWPKYWSFTISISPSNEYSRLMSFRMDWLYFLAVYRTLKSLLHHHNTRASILRHSAFFMV